MLLLICALLLSQEPDKAETLPGQWKLEPIETKTFEGELLFRVNLADGLAKDWGFFMTKAPELPTQKKVETLFQMPGATLKPAFYKDLSPLARDVIFQKMVTREKIQQESAQIKMTYKGEVTASNLVPLPTNETPPKVEPLKDSEKKMALAEFGDIRFKEKDFKNWMENMGCIRKADERDLDFAFKAFKKIHYKMALDNSEKQDRKSTAVSIIGKSDGAGISNLYVAVLRANNIPARTIWGRWIRTPKELEKFKGARKDQMGVRCEFFAENIGWVRADPATALYEKANKIDPQQFFGMDYIPFFVQHVDPSFEVINPLTNKRLSMISLQMPGYWFTLKDNTSSPKVSFVHEWTITKSESKEKE
ncbi:MAG: hypothetical protein RL595_2513 [Planctomycetota bacterium]